MKVAVSWSGGMESAVSLNRILKEGKHDVEYLVAFVSETWPANCHPVPIMELQAKSIGIPLLKLAVKEPFEKTYHEECAKLVKMGIEGIVTGDIYVVDELHGRWMDKVTEGLNLKVIMPLWQEDTGKVLDEEVSSGFKSVFTCLLKRCFTEEWAGRELNIDSVQDLKELAKEKGMDPCGENGEYHTMTIDGPIFNEKIEIGQFVKKQTDTRLYIEISEFCFKPKNS